MFICTKHYFPKMVLSGFGRQLWIIKGCLCRLLLTYFSLPQDFAPAAGSSSRRPTINPSVAANPQQKTTPQFPIWLNICWIHTVILSCVLPIPIFTI